MNKFDLTFICRKGKNHFAQPILKELEKTHSIQYLFPEHKRDLKLHQIKGKIIWVEWALKFAYLVSKKKWKQQKVFVRLHRWEIDTDYMKKIKWQNIDKIIFVNKNFDKQFIKNINSKVGTVTIPNALSISEFPMRQIKNTRKLFSYSIAFLPWKGYLELLDFFAKLLTRDNSFHLSIMARKPQTNLEGSYIAQINNRLQTLRLKDFVAKIERENITDFVKDRKNISDCLSQHDAIISFSKKESFHYAFAEGLLSGLQGFYNAWENPLIKEFWGKWGYNSEDEMINAIIDWSNLPLIEKNKIAKENRNYVIKKFGAKKIAKIYEKEFFT
jgi:glycosyltransferase involved in cell wall biosynthesis